MSIRPASGASLGLTPAPADRAEAEASATAFDRPQQERYVHGALIGRGGMGEIRTTYDARLGRTVALKTPVEHDASAERRLVAEATLTARLVHPGIVAVHDAGRTADGRPYYTMPIVHGRSLAQAIAEAEGPERLRLVRHFLDACEAIAYAHRQGVLHRDLKPSNILVGRFGETVVVDWGLAGPVGERARGLIGTPGYLPPEQARGDELGPPADVHALGVTLREILTGSPDGRPSASTPAELLAIIDRATRSDPAARYPDGQALAEDVAAWFEGRRVAAHHYRLGELAARIWVAHRVPLLAALLAVVGIAIASTVGYLRTTAERARAQSSEREAIAAKQGAERNLAQAEIAQALGAVSRGAWPEAELLAADALRHGPSPIARGVLGRFDPTHRPTLRTRSAMPACSHLVVSPRGDRVACVREGETRVGAPGLPWSAMQRLAAEGTPIALAGDGRVALIEHPSLGLRLVDASAPEHTRHLQAPSAGPPVAVANEAGAVAWLGGVDEHWWAPDSEHQELSTWCSDETHSIPGVAGQRSDGLRVVVCQDGSVVVRPDAASPPFVRTHLPAALGGPLGIAFAGEGSSLAAVGTADGSAVVLDLDSDRVVRTFSSETGTPFDLALTDTRLALSDGRDSVLVWEVRSGALVTRLPAHRARVRWVDDGQRLMVIGERVEEWELSPVPSRPHVISTGSGIAALSIAPDGRTFLTAHGDGRVRLGHVEQREPLAELPLHWSVAKDVELSPDGRFAVVAAAQADHLFVLDLEELLAVDRLPAATGRRVAWLRDEQLLLGVYRGGIDRWHHRTPDAPLLRDLSVRVADMESDADRRGVTALDAQGRLYRISAEPEATLELIALRPEARAVAGRAEVIYVADNERLEALELDGRDRSAPLVGTPVTEMALSAAGDLLALGHEDGRVWIWSTDSLSPLAALPGHSSRVAALAFDPQGQWLLSGSWDGDVRQWSLASLRAPAEDLLAEAERAWGLPLPTLLRTNAALERSR